MVIFMEAVCVVHVEEVKIVENKNLKIGRLCSFYVFFFFFLVAKIIRLFTHFPVCLGLQIYWHKSTQFIGLSNPVSLLLLHVTKY